MMRRLVGKLAHIQILIIQGHSSRMMEQPISKLTQVHKMMRRFVKYVK